MDTPTAQCQWTHPPLDANGHTHLGLHNGEHTLDANGHTHSRDILAAEHADKGVVAAACRNGPHVSPLQASHQEHHTGSITPEALHLQASHQEKHIVLMSQSRRAGALRRATLKTLWLLDTHTHTM